MEVKPRLIFTSKRARLRLPAWLLLTIAAWCAAFVLVVPGKAAAAVALTNQAGAYRWVDQFGIGGVSYSQRCNVVAPTVIDVWAKIFNVNNYSRGAVGETAGVCSAFQIMAGGVYAWDENITWVEAPVASGTISDYAVQDILVLCASMLCFGLGWISGQQR